MEKFIKERSLLFFVLYWFFVLMIMRELPPQGVAWNLFAVVSGGLFLFIALKYWGKE